MGGVYFVLISVCKSVKGQVDHTKQVSQKQVGLGKLLVGCRAFLEREHHQSQADQRLAQILLYRVLLLSENSSHDHHGHKLAGFHQNLSPKKIRLDIEME